MTVIHPFHPLLGKRFELLNCDRRWGQWRVFYVDEEGDLAFLPASWTDAGPREPFLEQAKGRAIARCEDLQRLAQMVADLVKRNTPHM